MDFFRSRGWARDSTADNERQGVFAHAQSRRHTADDDRVDEFPERSMDDDGNHVRTGHRHIFRGRGVGHAQARTHGVRFGTGNLQDVHRSTDQPSFRCVLSQDIDRVLSVFYARHFERFPGNSIKEALIRLKLN